MSSETHLGAPPPSSFIGHRSHKLFIIVNLSRSPEIHNSYKSEPGCVVKNHFGVRHVSLGNILDIGCSKFNAGIRRVHTRVPWSRGSNVASLEMKASWVQRKSGPPPIKHAPLFDRKFFGDSQDDKTPLSLFDTDPTESPRFYYQMVQTVLNHTMNHQNYFNV